MILLFLLFSNIDDWTQSGCQVNQTATFICLVLVQNGEE